MEKKIIFNNTEYLLNEELWKLSRILTDDKGIETKLTLEYSSNPFGEDETSVYAISEEKLFTLDLPSPDKSLNGLSREEYIEFGRPAIFYKASIGQILKIGQDAGLIFKDKQEYSYC